MSTQTLMFGKNSCGYWRRPTHWIWFGLAESEWCRWFFSRGIASWKLPKNTFWCVKLKESVFICLLSNTTMTANDVVVSSYFAGTRDTLKDATITQPYWKSTPLNFSKCKSLSKKQEWLFLGGSFKKLLSYLKSAIWFCQNPKLCVKKKKFKFGKPKLPYLGIYGLKFEKTNIMSFDIGSGFSKVPGTTFFEGPNPGPDPFYKVCPLQLYKS